MSSATYPTYLPIYLTLIKYIFKSSHVISYSYHISSQEEKKKKKGGIYGRVEKKDWIGLT